MLRRVSMMLTGLLLTTNMIAADKLKLSDVTDGTFQAKGVGSVTALGDGESYAQLTGDGRRVVQYSFKTGREMTTLFDVATVKDAPVEHIDGYTMSPDGRRMLIQTDTKPIYRRSFTATYYIYDMHNRRMTPLSVNGQQQTPLFSPDGQQIAFVREGNIFLVKLLYDNAEVQVTRDGRRNRVINGVPDWVNEEEFGLNSAMVFTADGRQLVWVRYDETLVPEVSMPQYTYKYPQAGEQNARVTVCSYDMLSRRTRQLDVPLDADGYVPRIRMTSDPERVAVYTLNRRQDCLRIYMVHPLSTVSRLVIEEKADRYVREEAIDGIRITEGHILLPSDRTGYMHLYLYNLNGQLLRQVDTGNYEVSQVYGYDEQTGDTYYASHENGATDQRVWVARKNGKRECLTTQAGWSTALFSAGFKYFMHTWSNLDTPPVYTLSTANGKLLATLEDNQELKEKMAGYEWGKRELFNLSTADGMTLNGWIVKPFGFSPDRKYPVIMYQYSGPGSQMVADRWGIGMAGQGALMEQYLCQQGFICVCVDGRGTGGRGAEFEKCTYLKLGQLEAQDQVEAARWLSRQPYIDATRIGIWGWSFGGFNTLMAMSEGSGAFRCGIAIAPVTSWRFYDTIYTERFMQTPQQNPTGYDDCPLARVSQMKGELLLCHGTADDNVHFRNTADYTDALVRADKDFQQLVYTNRNHSIRGGNTRQHLFRQCVRFFLRELKAE